MVWIAAAVDCDVANPLPRWEYTDAAFGQFPGFFAVRRNVIYVAPSQG